MRSIQIMVNLVLFAFCLTALPLQAEVPVPISYQGYLTDAAGDPVATAQYSITFSIWDASSAGNQKWTSGTQIVQVTNGIFDYLLGSNAAFPTDLFAIDTNLFLEIQVDPDPPISPRTKLASVAFAHRAETIGPNAKIGSSTQTGQLQLFQSGSALKTILLGNYFDQGGKIHLYDENGHSSMVCEPDAHGTGGWFSVYKNELSDVAFTIDGNFAGTEEPMVSISGSSNYVIFDMGNTNNDDIVQLPNNSVNSVEILDEPGIAQGRVAGNVDIAGATTMMIDVVTVDITIPTDGYIVVAADGQARFYGTTLNNHISIQIDETVGGLEDADYYYFAGFVAPPNNSIIWLPVSARRTYFKTAGTYTFRLEARDRTSNGGKYIWNPVITATFFPTSYGTVTTFASTPGSNPTAEEVTVSDQETGATTTSYKVDLRYYELKEKAARKAALEAKQELEQARNNANIQENQNE